MTPGNQRLLREAVSWGIVALIGAAAIMHLDTLWSGTERLLGLPPSGVTARQDDAGQEALLSAMLESVGELIWCTSVDGKRLLYMNSAAESIYGVSIELLTENPDRWFEAIHPEDRDEVSRRLNSLREQGQIEHEYRIVRPDGSIRWLQDRIRRPGW